MKETCFFEGFQILIYQI